MDTVTNLMYQNSTLIGAIILIGALAYLGTNTINPDHMSARRIVGYLTGALLVAIGTFSAYFGASKLLALIYAHVYTFDVFRVEWLGVGLVGLIAGFLIVGQAFRSL